MSNEKLLQKVLIISIIAMIIIFTFMFNTYGFREF